MAVDEALLDSAIEDNVATLRFYQWIAPTLSLGYFQCYSDRALHAASRESDLVRRQSGGGAILHDCELTYSITLPQRHSLARDPAALYTAVHHAFIQVLQPRLGSTPQPGWRLELNSKATGNMHENSFLCFERRASGDLLLVHARECDSTNSRPLAYKILGSAQRRYRGAILQHGSFLIARSSAAPGLPGWNDLTGDALSVDQMESALVRQLFPAWGTISEPEPLPPALRESAQRKERARYSSRSWTQRR
jgi:lipoate-protein ligase A